MNIQDLPAGASPAPLVNPVFPSRWQHFIWKNYTLVPPEKMAAILNCTPAEVTAAALEMGLPGEVKVSPLWLTRGYLTLIRSNWHLLNYEQLLQLLEWTPEKMAYTLKEEDFLWHKLGKLKPLCPELRYTPLSQEEKAATAALKAQVEKYFPAAAFQLEEEPFKFADSFGSDKAFQPGKNSLGFDFNFIHAYSAGCGDVLGEAEVFDPLPENLIAQYSAMGINGVWFQALLYLLEPVPGAEIFSAGWEKRIENLKKLVERCQKYGIRIFLYLNEPRTMPEAFYTLKPAWRGIETRGGIANCTTAAPEILEYLSTALEKIFTAVPGLGGILTITMSENCTNCHCDATSHLCPACSQVPPEKIIADINGAMEQGMHKAAPDAEMILYDWAWKRMPGDPDPAAFKKAVMERLPGKEHVYINAVSEWGKITRVGGVENYLTDYSISQIGPSEESKVTWRNALEKGLGTVAKVQMNNSWELAAIPYIPVPYLIREHLENLRNAGVRAVMLSWTLGGYPGGNLKLLHKTPEECAAEMFSPALAEKVCQAWRIFSEAFRNFPFCVGTVYRSPSNFGPMNQLYLEPSGYSSTMVGFPYDDLRGWRSVYPEDIFENQFELLSSKWYGGVQILEACRETVAPDEEKEFLELCRLAKAAYCHLRSTCLQVRFVRAREGGFDREVMKKCAREELSLASELAEIARRDSRIGFEASNHYLYTLNDLREKVLNCLWILEQLERN